MLLSSSNQSEPVHLTALPAEVLHHILQWLNPADLAALPLVCHMLHAFVNSNQALCREIYLNSLDTPENVQLDWERELHDLVRLQNICRNDSIPNKKKELGFVYETVDRLLKNASSSGHPVNLSSTHCASRNATILKNCFKSTSTHEAFLQQSFLFERVRNEHRHPIRVNESPKVSHQQSAKLHCLFGKPILNSGRTRSARTYPFACSKVYDLRQYTELTGWGPFMNDETDRVDWEKVEAIFIVLGNNISMKRLVSKIFADVWDSPFSGSWPQSYLPCLQPDLSPLEAGDPYGVTGTWYRIVCFLDYNDFFAYNFPMGDLTSDDAPRPALNVGEATRLIVMRVHVTSIEPPGPNDGQALPVVHFRGLSRSLDESWDDNANSELRGTVRLTKEGEVRWTTYSIFHGEERWRSEGIQIGGVRSARGVFGNWDFDPHGPAGPTAFWKASDAEVSGNAIHEVLPNDFFLAYSTLVAMDESESDPEAELDYMIDEDEEDDEDDIDMEPIAGELPGLLLDAEMEVIDVSGHGSHPFHEGQP